MNSLKTFLDERRTSDSDSTNTGMMKGVDLGRYVINDQEYDKFLELVHHHIFVKTPKTPSSLLEKRPNSSFRVQNPYELQKN